MRPKILLHNEMSLDGRITGFDLDMDRYYAIASELGADGVIAGSNTIVAAVPEIAPEKEIDKLRPDTFDDVELPWFFMIDSRGRIRSHHVFRSLPFIRDVVVLVSEGTPDDYISFLDERGYGYIRVGEQKVDLDKAFEEIGDRYGVSLLRIDSGGELNSVLIEKDLVDEISLIIDPVIVGRGGPTQFGSMELDRPMKMVLKELKQLDGGCIHLLYRISVQD